MGDAVEAGRPPPADLARETSASTARSVLNRGGNAPDTGSQRSPRPRTETHSSELQNVFMDRQASIRTAAHDLDAMLAETAEHAATARRKTNPGRGVLDNELLAKLQRRQENISRDPNSAFVKEPMSQELAKADHAIVTIQCMY